MCWSPFGANATAYASAEGEEGFAWNQWLVVVEELVLAACPITTQSMLDNCTQGSTCKQMTHQTRCLVT